MKRTLLAVSAILLTVSMAMGQDDEKDEVKRKFSERLFTGGSVSLAFYNNTFMIGASPVLGVNLASFIDAGIVFNYNYTSYRDYGGFFNDKLKQTVYGGGVFTKLYPVRFLFAQAQWEHNWFKQRYVPNFGPEETYRFDGNSFLVGGGYTTGRDKEGDAPFYYLAVLFDVSGNENSPYTDNYGRSIPIIRGGLQIPICRGENKKKGRGRY